MYVAQHLEFRVGSSLKSWAEDFSEIGVSENSHQSLNSILLHTMLAKWEKKHPCFLFFTVNLNSLASEFVK